MNEDEGLLIPAEITSKVNSFLDWAMCCSLNWLQRKLDECARQIFAGMMIRFDDANDKNLEKYYSTRMNNLNSGGLILVNVDLFCIWNEADEICM